VDLRVSTLPASLGEKVVIRILDSRRTVLSLDSLGLNEHEAGEIRALLENRDGVILVTGPTGSGKTTTLYSALRHVQSEGVNIVTVEDPVEYRLQGIVQVQVHEKAGLTFSSALRSILRQDPDVVLVGEMRDLETISAALTIAETGHLTLGTLHTNSCAQTINRIIDVFPTSQQAQVRAQLSLVLEGVLSQQLIPTADGRGRAMSLEIMVATPAIRNLIREEKIHQIYSAMQAGQKFGMQTMNQSLAELVQKRRISREEALNRSTLPEELAGLLGSAGVASGAPAAAAGAGSSPFGRR
jgi:twitching motility protein PilT